MSDYDLLQLPNGHWFRLLLNIIFFSYRVGENIHIVLLPLGGFLHLILAAVVYFLAARLHKQFTDAPECQLFTEERCNDETNDEWEMNNLVLREILRL